MSTAKTTKTPRRLYTVISPDGAERLVNATSPSAAINNIARPGYSAVASSSAEVARILLAGGKIIEAGETAHASEVAQESTNEG